MRKITIAAIVAIAAISCTATKSLSHVPERCQAFKNEAGHANEEFIQMMMAANNEAMNYTRFDAFADKFAQAM